MAYSSPNSTRFWLAVAGLAVGMMVWSTWTRADRLVRVAALTRSEATVQAESATGYAGGVRDRVMVDATGRTAEAVAQTQRMLATGDWRVRRIETENAPYGRVTHATMPVRLWLAAVAVGDHRLTNTSRGIAVERAGLVAAPVLQLLLLSVLALVTGLVTGMRGAALVLLGGATLFPWVRYFSPGADPETALQTVLALFSVLPLWRAVATDALVGGSRVWFALAGVCGGLGFWVSPAGQIAVLAGIFLGGIGAVRLRETAQTVPPWRVWSLAGAVTILLTYFVQAFPAGPGVGELRAVHPLDGLCWLGLGEVLYWCWRRRAAGVRRWTAREVIWGVAAAVAVVALPTAMFQAGNPGVLATAPVNLRLISEPDAIVHFPLWSWLQFEGLSLPALAALLPLAIVVLAFGALFRGSVSPAKRRELVLLLGVMIPVLALAAYRTGGAALLGGLLLLLFPVLVDSFEETVAGPRWRRIVSGLIVLGLLPGGWVMWPQSGTSPANALTRAEALAVVERDLAHWLAQRGGASPPVVHAPPGLTSALAYYGGLRGVGTLSWENPDGLAFLVRTAISTSREETAALLRARGVDYVVLPSWDGFFDGPLRAAAVQGGQMFHEGLAGWSLPLWLRPVPYHPPGLPGLEPVTVAVFQLVEEQEPPLAAARLADYFAEMADWPRAEQAQQLLLKYPNDFGVLVSRAQYWATRRDAGKFTPVFATLLERLAAGADRYLPWERRVRLAIVLAQGNRPDLAVGQMQRCAQEANETRLRTLTEDTLYQWLVLGRTFGVEITDPRLRVVAKGLLPAALQEGW